MIHIHSHMILTKVKIPGPAWDQQMAWVRGYILALEDILGDLEQNTPEDLPDAAASESHAFIEGWTWHLGHVHDHVTKTLAQARITLATMEKMEDEHLEAVQREPGAGGVAGDLRGGAPASGPPEASDPEDQGRVPDPGAV